MCVSRSGYYKWKKRDKSKRDIKREELIALVEAVHADHRLFLGSAWIHRVLVSICLGRGTWYYRSWPILHRLSVNQSASGRQKELQR